MKRMKRLRITSPAGVFWLLILTTACRNADEPAAPNKPAATDNSATATIRVIDKITRKRAGRIYLDTYEQDRLFYNDEGKISKIFFFKHGIYEFLYNASGKVSEYFYEKDNFYEKKSLTSEDLNQSIIGKATHKVVLTYDDSGRLIEDAQYVKNPSHHDGYEVNEAYKITYDADGNITGVDDGTGWGKHTFYGFDKNGNPEFTNGGARLSNPGTYDPNDPNNNYDGPSTQFKFHESLNPLYPILRNSGLVLLRGKAYHPLQYSSYYPVFKNNLWEVITLPDEKNMYSASFSDISTYPAGFRYTEYAPLFRRHFSDTLTIEYKEVELRN